MRRVLILDDEVHVLAALQRALRQAFAPGSVTVEAFSEPEAAVLRAGEASFDVVMSDYRMPGLNGADVLHLIKGIQPEAVRLVLSASTDFSEIMNAVNRAEVFRYVAKPWQIDELTRIFEAAFVRRDELVGARLLAEQSKVTAAQPSPQELEATRLEAEEPGITRVNWDKNGGIRLD
ncbi:MAG TPA: response regulator [Telluria sp.]